MCRLTTVVNCTLMLWECSNLLSSISVILYSVLCELDKQLMASHSGPVKVYLLTLGCYGPLLLYIILYLTGVLADHL